MEIATAKVIKAVTQINLCSNQLDNCDSFRHYTNLEYPVELIESTLFRSEFQALQDNEELDLCNCRQDYLLHPQ